MSVLTRIADLISANLNALLDGAENPERLLAQVIREMEDSLMVARKQGATAIAAERRLARELEQNRAAATHWKDQARLALTNRRDDLARKALARKLEYDDLVGALETQWQGDCQTSAEVKAALHALETRLAEARRKQRTLLARHRAASILLEVQRTVGRGMSHGCEPLTRLARYEERLIDLEDRLLAQVELGEPVAELEIELANLRADKRVDEELTLLKGELVSQST